jgi:hypothetical protein
MVRAVYYPNVSLVEEDVQKFPRESFDGFESRPTGTRVACSKVRGVQPGAYDSSKRRPLDSRMEMFRLAPCRSPPNRKVARADDTLDCILQCTDRVLHLVISQRSFGVPWHRVRETSLC